MFFTKEIMCSVIAEGSFNKFHMKMTISIFIKGTRIRIRIFIKGTRTRIFIKGTFDKSMMSLTCFSNT